MTVWQIETSPNISKCLLVTNFPESPMTWYGNRIMSTPKWSTYKFHKPMSMLSYLAKVTLQIKSLSEVSWEGKLSWMTVITKGLIRKKQECQSQRRRDYKNRDQSDATDGFEDGRMPRTKKCSQPPEIGKSKEWIFPGSLQKEHNPINILILV